MYRFVRRYIKFQMHVCSNCKKELTDAELCIDCQRECHDYCQYLRAEEEHEDMRNWYQVTKEMAIDAGDRRLEGQWIRQ